MRGKSFAKAIAAKVFLLDFIRRHIYRWTKRVKRVSKFGSRFSRGRSFTVVHARSRLRFESGSSLSGKRGAAKAPRFFRDRESRWQLKREHLPLSSQAESKSIVRARD